MHPFAKYIQILGKGRNGMRPLSREEAYEAMQMSPRAGGKSIVNRLWQGRQADG